MATGAGPATPAAVRPRQAWWTAAYWILWGLFLVSAALNMLGVGGGFFTNHLADVVVPALLYLVTRGLGPGTRWPAGALQRWFGTSAERAAAVLFLASTATEVSQYCWPHGVFSGRFDPLDIVAYAAGVGVCYLGDRLDTERPTVVA